MLDQIVSEERAVKPAALQNAPGDFSASNPFLYVSSIAHICHDLRLPLASILANAEFLTRPDISEMERTEFYLEILQAIELMNQMISSVLEYSKEGDAFQPTVASIVDTVDRAIRMTRTKQEFRRVSIEYRHKGLAMGWFDSHRIERAVANLVMNAIEAVSPDSGRIVLHTVGDSSCLQIGVGDNGPGIHPAIRNSLFQPFVCYGKPGGSGLGLAIARKIIEDHGGEIDLDDKSGTGTLFKITIPFAIPRRARRSSP